MLLRNRKGELGAGSSTVVTILVAVLVIGAIGYVVVLGTEHSAAEEVDEGNALMLNQATAEWAEQEGADLSDVTMNDLVPEYIDEEPPDPYDAGRSYEPNEAGIWIPLGPP